MCSVNVSLLSRDTCMKVLREIDPRDCSNVLAYVSSQHILSAAINPRKPRDQLKAPEEAARLTGRQPEKPPRLAESRSPQ